MPNTNAKLKPVTGSKVRLLRDISTRDGRKFRAGLTMTLRGTYGRYYLGVWVRRRSFCLTLQKKDYPFYFEVVSPPHEPEDENEDQPVEEGDGLGDGDGP